MQYTDLCIDHGCAVASIREDSEASPPLRSPTTATPTAITTTNPTAITTAKLIPTPTTTADPAATVTTTSKVQNIHIHLPSNQSELKSDEIHIHLNLNGSETKVQKVQSTPPNANAIIGSQSVDGKLPKVKQVNGPQMNGYGPKTNGYVNGLNGHHSPVATSPSWSNGTINGSGIRFVPAAASVSS
jgi:hypothetical protein